MSSTSTPADSKSNSNSATGNAILAANGGTFAPFLTDKSESPFDYKGWMKTRVHNIQRRDLKPLNEGKGFGSTSVWEIPKNGDLIGDVQLRFNIRIKQSQNGPQPAANNANTPYLAAFVPNTAADRDTLNYAQWTTANPIPDDGSRAGRVCTYTGLVGGAAYAAVDRVRVKYVSNLVQEFRGFDIFREDAIMKDREAREACNVVTGLTYGIAGQDDIGAINVSAAAEPGDADAPAVAPVVGDALDINDRIDPQFIGSFGTGIANEDLGDLLEPGGPVGVGLGTPVPAPPARERHFSLELPFFWTCSPRNWLPYTPLATDMRIEIDWAAVERVAFTNCPEGATYEIVDPTLRVAYVHVTTDHRRELEAIVNSTEHGINYKTMDIEHQHQRRISAAETPTKVEDRLTNIRGAVHDLIFGLRRVRDVDTPNQSRPFLFHKIHRYRVAANNGDVWPETDHVYSLYVSKEKNYSGDLPVNLYHATWSLRPEVKEHALGHLDFGNLHDPRIIIEKDNVDENPAGGPLVDGIPIGVASSQGICGDANSDMYLDTFAHVHQLIIEKGGEIVKVFN